jgi:predicted nuclease of predicted toxin-antitoxin system
MKLLLDQGLPRSAAAALQSAGFEAVHVADLGLSRAEDQEILERGAADGCVVVTLDADFGTLLALSGKRAPSVIRIRVEGLRGEQAAGLLLQVVKRYRADLEAGAIVSIQPGRLRLRRLPIRPT